MALQQAGIEAQFILLSAALPQQSGAIVSSGCEPAVCSREVIASLDAEAERQGREVALHLVVDTGMGRIGIRPDEVEAFLQYCTTFPHLKVRALMSHFPCADEADKCLSLQQVEQFKQLRQLAQNYGIETLHMANSAALFDLPDSRFDAARPGIAIYGLRPSAEIANPRVNALQPVLEWRSRITFLKEVPAGTGLSYGHDYVTDRPALIATIPVGYGDGFRRRLSNKCELLVHGVRCPQVGRITMDQSMLDVSALRGRVALGDEVVLIGHQGGEVITADEWAAKLGTINYEITTTINRRVPRVAVGGSEE
jgi:alanine racemase